ncbi:MAG: type IV pilus assembly protein PilX [Motiliproteus sp.]|jgi:type IV pilus assembly protein PilX
MNSALLHRQQLHRQQGITLIICMIMLVVVTLLGLSSIRDATMEEKMAGNMKSRSVAFQAAESALREGEAFVNNPSLPPFDGSGGLYPPLAGIWGAGAASWANNSLVRRYSSALAGVAAAPVYIIEELSTGTPSASVAANQYQNTSSQAYFRITARAVGSTDRAVVMLQTVYKN